MARYISPQKAIGVSVFITMICSFGLMSGVIVLSEQIRTSQGQVSTLRAQTEILESTIMGSSMSSINYTTTLITETAGTIQPNDGPSNFPITCRLYKLVDELSRLRMFAFEFDPPANVLPVIPDFGIIRIFCLPIPLTPLTTESEYIGFTTLFDSEIMKFQPQLIGNIVEIGVENPEEFDIYIAADVGKTLTPFPPGTTSATWTEPFRIYVPGHWFAVPVSK